MLYSTGHAQASIRHLSDGQEASWQRQSEGKREPKGLSEDRCCRCSARSTSAGLPYASLKDTKPPRAPIFAQIPNIHTSREGRIRLQRSPPPLKLL